MNRKAGFTGTREGLTSLQRDNLARFLTATEPNCVHHGDCIGADAEMHTLAQGFGVPIVIHPPTSEKYRAFCGANGSMVVSWHHKKPYLERNRNIVDETMYLIACPKENHPPGQGPTWFRAGGTWYTVDYALKQLIRPVYLFYPDGRVDRLQNVR